MVLRVTIGARIFHLNFEAWAKLGGYQMRD